MIPAAFEYLRARSAEEAVALLAEHGADAKLLAGGHSLLPMMKLRLARPAVLVDVGRLAELDYVRVDGAELAVGAATRHAVLAASAEARADVPLLAHAAGLVGDPQVRHRGTLGGSLAHADPAADLPAAALALGARLVLLGPGGRREVAADDFFAGYFETALGADELLVEVRLPRRRGEPWGYQKFTRRANDWAIVGVAATAGRIALAGMGPRPLRAAAAERAWADGAGAGAAGALAAEGTDPGEDMHADPDYRRHLARVLTARALRAAGAAP